MIQNMQKRLFYDQEQPDSDVKRKFLIIKSRRSRLKSMIFKDFQTGLRNHFLHTFLDENVRKKLRFLN
jgi:hypothetical protein